MVLHWKKIFDTAKLIIFKNTNDRAKPRLFTAKKVQLKSGEKLWSILYTSGDHTKLIDYKKTKSIAVEEIKKYLKSNK
jgi:hypothetical protein